MESINLIPITKINISKERWLSQKIKYETDISVKDILKDMAYKSYEWINYKNDLEHVQDYDSFINNFIQLIYDYQNGYKYVNNMTESEEQLFDLKYLEEISELFNGYKETVNYYGLELFQGDFNIFFEFIKKNIIIHEFSDDEITEDEYSED